MELRDQLTNFQSAILAAAIYAPDDYPKSSYSTYESNIADINQLWAEIKPSIKNGLDSVAFIEIKISEAVNSFENGEKEKGQLAFWVLYNMGLPRLAYLA
jgi:hypothetical protein